MRLLLTSALLTACSILPAQGVFNNVDKPGDAICPMIEVDKTALNFGAGGGYTTGGKVGATSLAVAWHQRASLLYPVDQRKDVSKFTAYDEKGKPTSIASLKGKIVLVALWSQNCDPSAKLIMELASVYPNRDKFNFAVLAVNFDTTRRDITRTAGGWAAIQHFKIRNRDFFSKSDLPFFVPGVGDEGASQMFDQVKSVPVFMVIDAEGRMGSVDIGYEPNIVAKRLSLFIREAKGEMKIQGAPAPAADSKPAPQ